MTTVTEPAPLPVLDNPPASGVWVEHDDLELTGAEIAAGNQLGRAIDDDDAGGSA